MNQYPIIFCLLTLLYVIFLPHLKAVELCPSFYCNDQKHDRDPIHFPFRVPENQTTRCGYPGFDLSCNSNNQTLLSSLSSEPLIVEGISYSDQLIWLSDPNHCTPKRVMDLSLTSTPFSFGRFGSAYTIVNCSQPAGSNPELPRGSSVITCMSEGNYTVIATFKKMAERELVRERGCEVMNKINAAFWWRDMEEYDYFYPTDLSDVLVQLNWGVPSCGRCDLRGGSCGFVGGMGLEVGCVIPESSGFPMSAKYGLILGAGIPILLCIIGLIFYISSRFSAARNPNNRRTNTESSPSVFPQPIVLTLGLDEPTIESYPKTVLGESKRLPKPSDNTCPICLSEYQPKETLRTIPECKHYFHADCVDEWLRINATCPLCRNSPQPSSAVADC